MRLECRTRQVDPAVTAYLLQQMNTLRVNGYHVTVLSPVLSFWFDRENKAFDTSVGL
jgi:hypothetical protein